MSPQRGVIEPKAIGRAEGSEPLFVYFPARSSAPSLPVLVPSHLPCLSLTTAGKFASQTKAYSASQLVCQSVFHACARIFKSDWLH